MKEHCRGDRYFHALAPNTEENRRYFVIKLEAAALKWETPLEKKVGNNLLACKDVARIAESAVNRAVVVHFKIQSTTKKCTKEVATSIDCFDASLITGQHLYC